MLWVLLSGGDWGKAFPEEVTLELEIRQMRTFQAEGTSAIQNLMNASSLEWGELRSPRMGDEVGKVNVFSCHNGK